MSLVPLKSSRKSQMNEGQHDRLAGYRKLRLPGLPVLPPVSRFVLEEFERQKKLTKPEVLSTVKQYTRTPQRLKKRRNYATPKARDKTSEEKGVVTFDQLPETWWQSIWTVGKPKRKLCADIVTEEVTQLFRESLMKSFASEGLVFSHYILRQPIVKARRVLSFREKVGHMEQQLFCFHPRFRRLANKLQAALLEVNNSACMCFDLRLQSDSAILLEEFAAHGLEASERVRLEWLASASQVYQDLSSESAWAKHPSKAKTLKVPAVALAVVNLQLQKSSIKLLELCAECLVDHLKMPRFVISVKDNEGTLTLVPDEDVFAEELQSFFAKLMDNLPTSLNSIQLSSKKYARLNLSVPDEVYFLVRNSVKKYARLVNEEIESLLLRLSKDWRSLLNGDHAVTVQTLVEKSSEPEEIIHAIAKLAEESSRVKRLPSTVYLPRSNVSLRPLKEQWQSSLKSFCSRLRDYLSYQHRKDVNGLLMEFQAMQDQLLAPPTNTKELLKKSAFIEEARNDALPVLTQRVSELKQRFAKILDAILFPPEDVLSNAVVFNLPQTVLPAFDQGLQILNTQRRIFEDTYQNTLESTHIQLNKLRLKLKNFDHYSDIKSVQFYYEDVVALQRRMKKMQQTVSWVNQEENLLKFPNSAFPEVADINVIQLRYLRKPILNANLQGNLEPYAKLFSTALKWKKALKRWMDGSFVDLNSEMIENETDELSREMHKLQKIFRARCKQQEMEEGGKTRWLVDASDPELFPAPLKICYYTIEDVKKFKVNLPVIAVLCNPGLRQRHWQEISAIVGKDITPDTGTTLRKMLRLPLMESLEKFEVISGAASKEFSLERGMKIMLEEWNGVAFTTTRYRDSETVILASVDDIQTLLDDHLVKTQTMKGSPFVKPVEGQIMAWEGRLLRIQRTIDEWLSVQSQWLYLEPIFSSPNIVDQMPEEGKLFQIVDNSWKTVMEQVLSNPLVMQSAGSEGMLETLLVSSQLLEEINFGVNAYLDKKRLYFSRFFFLSNEEMLEILSETKDPLRVQPHLKKCFEGISALDFDEDLNILAMVSPQGERVPFLKAISTVEAQGSVEQWLLEVQTSMKAAVHHVISQALLSSAQQSRKDWVINSPGQAILCASQVLWTAAISEAILKGPGALKQYWKQLQNQLMESAELVRTPLPKLARITLGALVVTEVHTRDVVQELIDHNVATEQDFHWIAQLRYYLEDAHIGVHMINASLRYAYEYLGNTGRLVITPLTDRCYRTLIGAYSLHLSGAPEGPAGTGKTETTKDLAKALAVHCIVFNCSDGLDYVAMAKFFKGLACSGAWACFDEFNRIEAEVLSVVAQQMLCILSAMQSKASRFIFDGTELTLNPMCFVCVTMNPGYAGRSELPDNLRVLFRTVAMMIPDYSMIGEISLYSYGFTDARNLAVKIVTTYKLCSEQLSTQNHYDYGMRAVKAVLVAAGNLKVQNLEDSEESLILRSLSDVNVPKFLAGDLALFQGIIGDLFPGVALPNSQHVALQAAIRHVCLAKGLEATESFCQKVIQMYETMIVRHGFMLVGRPMGGKSTVLKVLAGALNYLSGKEKNPELGVIYRILNPKSVTPGLLFGQFDPVTHEWVDGIVSMVFRELATSDFPGRKWVIFDGPVDAVWIENLNTVLDDNKKLCLTSGEIIQVSPTMSVIFEVMDLSQASPATVSRCGMVYVDPGDLGWSPVLLAWKRAPNVGQNWKAALDQQITILSYWLIPAALNWINKLGKQLVATEDNSKVGFFFQLVQALMNRACVGLKDVRYGRAWLQASFLFSLTWTIGGLLDAESRVKFDTFIRSILTGKNDKFPFPPGLGRWECHLPSDGTLYDYIYEYKQRGQWKQWAETIRNTVVPDTTSLRRLIVPTIDTARTNFLLEICIANGVPVLLVGPTGTGKTISVQEKLNALNPQQFTNLSMTFTAQTTAAQVQDMITMKLERRKKGVLGPSPGKKCLVFIDDVNMPSREVYGAQPPLELLRQYFDHQQWYDRKDATLLFLQDIQWVAAMGPPGGSRQDVSPRFLRHFLTIAVNPFSDATMTHIFSTILSMHLKNGNFAPDMFSAVGAVVGGTLEIYRSALKTLLPTPAKSHYVFNLRDFARVILGCCLVKKEAVNTRKQFLRLWVHEVLRVFGDRLVGEEDSLWLYTLLRECVRTHFKENFDVNFEHLGRVDGKVPMSNLQHLLFGDYMIPDLLHEDRVYEEIHDMHKLHRVIESYVVDYNNTNKTYLDLIVFQYVIKHLSRVSRVLRIPGGHALLIGVGGSGRQSLTKLAGSMAGFTLFQPTVKPNYGFQEWRDDVKRALRAAGAQGKDVVFLLLDTQLLQQTVFLQDVDALLNGGEIANLFTVEEKQEVIELVRSLHRQNEPQGELSPALLYQYFMQQVRDRLHLVLAFSPLGSALRDSVRYFPSLINCCTIDWFEAWPEEALEKVAESFLTSVDLSHGTKESVVKVCKHFHTSSSQLSQQFTARLGRQVYVTPASYLGLLEAFKTLMAAQQKSIQMGRDRYCSGLARLAQAALQVDRMQKELSLLQPKLVEASAATDAMMVAIERESGEVEKASEQVRFDEAQANIQAAEAQALKQECEAELAEALPALEAALAALDTLKPADITLVKSMKNPPKPIKIVMAAVCVMKDVKPEKIQDPGGSGKKIFDYWGPSKKLLNDLGFLTSLKEYNKDNIPSHVMTKIRQEFLPNPDFEPSVVAKASSAAEGLCKWVKAMEMYDKAAKIVLPKKARLAAAEACLSDTLALLANKRAQLQELESRLERLKSDYEQGCRRREQLAEEVDMCAKKLARAEALIGGLGEERERWSEAEAKLCEKYNNLAGDILLSAGCIAYLGPFTSAFREKAISDWVECTVASGIPCSTSFRLSDILGSPVEIQAWTEAGLPRDAFSIDNAIMIFNQKKWPLLIDPQGQAGQWLKTSEASRNLTVLRPTQPDWLRVLETCLPAGRPVLIENLGETLDPALQPLLVRATIKQGGIEMIQLGDALVEYNPLFRLYMTTKLRNPHFLPEVTTKVAIINAGITAEGLEDQLLAIVVAKERPDLEELRQKLVSENAACRVALQEVEDRILATLAASEGNLLEDEAAIQVLSASKKISQDISQKQELASQTALSLEASRSAYKPVAAHATVLFFAVADLLALDPMYQYSLSWFIRLFVCSIEKSERSEELVKRLSLLQDHFMYGLYCNVCRSLFEKDKLVFSMTLTTSLLLARGCIGRQELRIFLTGTSGLQAQQTLEPPPWLKPSVWNELGQLVQLEPYNGLLVDLFDNSDSWRKVVELGNPQESALPEPWETRLSKFQKLLLLRFLALDKITVMVRSFVSQQLGLQYVTPPPFDLTCSFDDSGPIVPLIFLLSPGTDPMDCLMRFAEERGCGGDKLHIVSLGQGQGALAEQKIATAVENGHWVVLQNCHLAASWMSTLEKLCENWKLENVNSNFRLWLTSYPSDKFPVSLLQGGVKITNEPPSGLRENLLRTFIPDPLLDDELPAKCTKLPVPKRLALRKLCFALCFFHALVQERKSFGPIGWNIPYAFSDSDLRISLRQLQMFVRDYAATPYDALQYLIGECHYGGRVTDDWDRRTLHTLLQDFCNHDLVQAKNYSVVQGEFSAQYMIPHSLQYEDYLRWIENLPMIQPPNVFGMHDNVAIARDLLEGRILLDSLWALLSSGDSISEAEQNTSDGNLAERIAELLAKLPSYFDLDAASAKYPISYHESLNTVLVQEMARYNNLLQAIRQNLEALKKAVQGYISMTAELEYTAKALTSFKVPETWKAISYPSLKPLGSYCADLIQRVEFFRQWYESGQPNRFWLPAFYFPQSFLTGVLQTAARRQKLPVDFLVHDCQVLSPALKDENKPDEGVYVTGLYLAGAKWDIEKGVLAEQDPQKLWDLMPPLWLIPRRRDAYEAGKGSSKMYYSCPVYRTSERQGVLSTTGHSTNFIIALPLPSDISPSHWVKRGVALVCQLDD